jgi:hypothetical protein
MRATESDFSLAEGSRTRTTIHKQTQSSFAGTSRKPKHNESKYKDPLADSD